MSNNISHHEVNEETHLRVNKKKHEAKKRKFQPKTKIQRLKKVFYILTAVWLFCQFCSALMASTGFIHLAMEQLNNPFLSIPLVLVFCIGIELAFNWINKSIHEQKYDDETPVSPILYGLVCLFGVIYAVSTFFGTPYAVKFLAAQPDYHNIELINLNHDKLIKIDTIKRNVDIFNALNSAASFAIANQKRDCNSCPYRLRSSAVKPHRKKVYRTDSLVSAKEKVFAILMSDKKDAISLAQEENKDMKSVFDTWCDSFGFGLSLLTLFLLAVFIPSYAWCAKYERDEVEDNESILALQEGEKDKEKDAISKLKSKGEGQSNPKVIDNEPSATIGFATAHTKEGDIDKGEGRKHDRVYVMVNGQLDPRTFGEMNTLINGQYNKNLPKDNQTPKTKARIKHLTNIRNLLS
tara:strand:- start:84 stop:1307 length:1224 start_codon:yes stop_codon:yes gene_type:complete